MSILSLVSQCGSVPEGFAREQISAEAMRSRRQLLSVAGITSLISASASTSAQVSRTGSISDKAKRMRLLRRITYGPTEADVTQIETLGFDAYLDQQLAYEDIDDSACNALLTPYISLNMQPRDLNKLRSEVPYEELAEAKIVRSLYSKRQLYEKMVEFWTDHFNIYFHKVGFLKTVDDRVVIRTHALGNFYNMLHASAISPAMLVYLDNDPSSKEDPNENYARELMELHTMGVKGGYSQEDVRQVARCLTGWGVKWWPDNAPDKWMFYFDKYQHYNGPKRVLNQDIPAGGGIKDGQTVLNIIQKRRSTAEFISTKMIKFLLRPDPSPELIKQVADVFQTTKGDIRAMIKVILTQDNIANAPLKFKRPFHLVISALRQSNAKITDYTKIREALDEMGHFPFDWAPPNGYPDAMPFWAGFMLPRWNFVFSLMDGMDWVKVDQFWLLKGAFTASEVTARISKLLFQNEMTSEEKADIMTFLLPDGDSAKKVRNAFALSMASPGFQRY